MSKTIKEKKMQLIEFLTKEKEKTEKVSGYRTDPELKKIYEYIIEQLSALKMELFRDRYEAFEQTLDGVLGISR